MAKIAETEAYLPDFTFNLILRQEKPLLLPHMDQAKLKQGVLYMLIASFCFALVGACTRLLRDSISSVELVFFRNLIGVLFIGYSVMRRPLQQVGGKPALLVFRGVVGTIALYTFFYSITQIGLAEAITYQQTYPVFIAVFSVFVAGEGLRRKEWMAVILGFAGICFIFVPQMSGGLLSARNHVIGITNAILTAFAYMSIRGLSAYYDSRSIVLSFMISGIILPIISMGIAEFYEVPQLDFIIASYVTPKGSAWLWILLLGVAAMIGQIYLTKAFSYGKAGIISAVGFSNIIFSIIFGVILGDPSPGMLAYFGIALVIISGVMISWQGKKK
ncbi:DMT family transporter [Jiulongibacter sp. NS-SX5]|uniref:DMT family transporter n=1 Tax=Jiulongibacter sp. NS-SX5 TaxID=3463854 RepID=UPI004057FC90